MKALLTIILCLNFSIHPEVKKRVLPYGIVILKADLIVQGKISKVSHSVYEYDLEITDYIKGESEKIITVDMWKEWTCDRRIKSPKIDQKLILFLTKNKNNEYNIINGSTGELFITENDAIETFTYYKNFPKLDELKKGIQQFIQAFEYNGSLYPKLNEETYFKRRINQSEIDRMITENQFFKSTVNGIRYFEKK